MDFYQLINSAFIISRIVCIFVLHETKEYIHTPTQTQIHTGHVHTYRGINKYGIILDNGKMIVLFQYLYC